MSKDKNDPKPPAEKKPDQSTQPGPSREDPGKGLPGNDAHPPSQQYPGKGLPGHDAPKK